MLTSLSEPGGKQTENRALSSLPPQKYLISIALKRCLLIELFAMPTAVVLLTFIGVGDCGRQL